MNKELTRKLTTAALLIFVGVLFSPRVLAKGYTSFQAFIYDYQTLITGLLAIFGAAFTVWQMRSSDRASMARHKELIGLQTRGEKRLVERLCNPTISLLEQHIVSLREIGEPMPLSPSEPASKVGELRLWQAKLLNHLNNLEQDLTNRVWSEADVLFSAELRGGHDATIQRCQSVKTSLSEAKALLSEIEERPHVRLVDLSGKYGILLASSLLDLIACIELTIGSMNALAGEYGVRTFRSRSHTRRVSV